MQSAARPDTDKVKATQPGLDGTCREVYVGQGIQLIDNDVDVVTSDTRREDGEALALVRAGDGVKFATLYFAFTRVEVRGNGRYAPGV